MINEDRLPDDNFPMLMQKDTLSSYLGISVDTIDKFVAYEGLSNARWRPGSVKKAWFIKTKVNEWRDNL